MNQQARTYVGNTVVLLGFLLLISATVVTGFVLVSVPLGGMELRSHRTAPPYWRSNAARGVRHSFGRFENKEGLIKGLSNLS